VSFDKNAGFIRKKRSRFVAMSKTRAVRAKNRASISGDERRGSPFLRHGDASDQANRAIGEANGREIFLRATRQS